MSGRKCWNLVDGNPCENTLPHEESECWAVTMTGRTVHPPFVILDITGGSLSPAEQAIHTKYQGDDPTADYYDPTPAECSTCGGRGTVPWMSESDPNLYQEPDADGRVPCPDCAS